MPAFNPLNVISDPDSLNQGTEVTISTSARTIKLNIAGNLDANGVTLKCLYSFLKEEWRTSATLIKFPFPMTPITDEQFEFYNGWNLDKTGSGSSYTPNLIRTGGWAVKHPTTGADSERWAGVITLGTLGTTDQVYFQQINSVATDNTTNFVLTNTVNQAVQFYSDPNGDGVTTDGYDYSQYLKLFCREWQKTYVSSAISDIGVPTLTYQAYRFPLTNGTDSKIVSLGVTEGDAAGNVWPYNEMDITWYANAQLRTGFLTPANAYFKVIIDGDNASNAASNPTAEQIYAFTQARLRQNININVGNGSGNTSANVKIGKVVPEKLLFVGDELRTLGQSADEEGVFIDNYNDIDLNRLRFAGYDLPTGGNAFPLISFPFTAVLTLTFGDNLKTDGNAIYRVFFTNDALGANVGNNYGTANAIIVNTKAGVPMANTVSGQSTIQLSYDYDGNNQRGGTSAGNVAPITVVAIGLGTAQYVSATGTIERTVTNSVSLVAPLERNYANP